MQHHTNQARRRLKPLEELIKDEIRTGGPMTFARFMELALYHPEMGYYGSGRAKIGKAGDYYTNPQASPVFGYLLAEVFERLKDALGGGPLAMVEMGAGEGHLALDFLRAMSRRHAGSFQGLRYIIIERSPGMRERQEAALYEFGSKVEWLDSLDRLPGPVTGVFFSNELVDALPFHRVRQDEDSLKELYVSLRKNALADTPGAPSSPGITRYLNRLGLRLPSGMTTEVNLQALEWIRAVSDRLRKGFVITVDYGYTACEYYAPERSAGTFLCYHEHTAGENPYRLIGEQDITAHVDFSSVAFEGKASGLTPLLYTEQTSFFLEAAGWLEQSLRDSGASQKELEETGRGLKTILHPEWMGGAFKVLVQSKGIENGGLFDGARNRLDELLKEDCHQGIVAL